MIIEAQLSASNADASQFAYREAVDKDYYFKCVVTIHFVMNFRFG
jgi:hypothetical protein